MGFVAHSKVVEWDGLNSTCFPVFRVSFLIRPVVRETSASSLYPCFAPLDKVGVQNAILFQIERHRVLGQKGCLQPDFSTYPFAFAVWCIRRVIASPAASKLWAKICALNLIELLDVAPRGVTKRTGNVDLESHHCHF